jgi:hypothetical protein
MVITVTLCSNVLWCRMYKLKGHADLEKWKAYFEPKPSMGASGSKKGGRHARGNRSVRTRLNATSFTIYDMLKLVPNEPEKLEAMIADEPPQVTAWKKSLIEQSAYVRQFVLKHGHDVLVT